jgi:phage-related protein (TIGR01555 family)
MSNVVRPEQGYFSRFRAFDSMRSFISGLGMPDRDKAAGLNQRFTVDLLEPEQLDAAYRGDWIARKIVDIPAFDACREWRNWKAEQDQIEKIEGTERVFGMQRKLMQGIARARLYGGSALVMGIKNQEWEEELDVKKVKKDGLAFLHWRGGHLANFAGVAHFDMDATAKSVHVGTPGEGSRGPAIAKCMCD